MTSRRDFQVKLEPEPDETEMVVTLNAGTAGDGSAGDQVIWEKPRLARPGREPLLLRDVAAVTTGFPVFREHAFSQIARVLGVAFEARALGRSPSGPLPAALASPYSANSEKVARENKGPSGRRHCATNSRSASLLISAKGSAKSS